MAGARRGVLALAALAVLAVSVPLLESSLVDPRDPSPSVERHPSNSSGPEVPTLSRSRSSSHAGADSDAPAELSPTDGRRSALLDVELAPRSGSRRLSSGLVVALANGARSEVEWTRRDPRLVLPYEEATVVVLGGVVSNDGAGGIVAKARSEPVLLVAREHNRKRIEIELDVLPWMSVQVEPSGGTTDPEYIVRGAPVAEVDLADLAAAFAPGSPSTRELVPHGERYELVDDVLGDWIVGVTSVRGGATTFGYARVVKGGAGSKIRVPARDSEPLFRLRCLGPDGRPHRAPITIRTVESRGHAEARLRADGTYGIHPERRTAERGLPVGNRFVVESRGWGTVEFERAEVDDLVEIRFEGLAQLVVEPPGNVGRGGIRVRPIGRCNTEEGRSATVGRVETTLQPGRYRVSLVRLGQLEDGLHWSVHLEETAVDVDLPSGRTTLVLAAPELHELTVDWAVKSPVHVLLESVQPDRYKAVARAISGGRTRFPGLPKGRYVLRGPGIEAVEVSVPGGAVWFP